MFTQNSLIFHQIWRNPLNASEDPLIFHGIVSESIDFEMKSIDCFRTPMVFHKDFTLLFIGSSLIFKINSLIWRKSWNLKGNPLTGIHFWLVRASTTLQKSRMWYFPDFLNFSPAQKSQADEFTFLIWNSKKQGW